MASLKIFYAYNINQILNSELTYQETSAAQKARSYQVEPPEVYNQLPATSKDSKITLTYPRNLGWFICLVSTRTLPNRIGSTSLC